MSQYKDLIVLFCFVFVKGQIVMVRRHGSEHLQHSRTCGLSLVCRD